MRNPQAFQQFQNLQKNQNDPQQFLNELTSKYTPEQMQQFKKYASGFGFSDEQLKNFGINSK
jgi:hypothetical protein